MVKNTQGAVDIRGLMVSPLRLPLDVKLLQRKARVRARYPAVVRTGTCRQACAGRRHVRPSYHTGGTEITILLALDARGHVTVAPTSSGLTA